MLDAADLYYENSTDCNENFPASARRSSIVRGMAFQMSAKFSGNGARTKTQKTGGAMNAMAVRSIHLLRPAGVISMLAA